MSELSGEPIRVAGIVEDSITDGPGIRLAVFVQGCPRRCKGCHNPDALPFEGGTPLFADEILNRLTRNPLVTGLTISGGEPFAQASALVPLCRQAKAMGYELAVYTGYTFETLLERNRQDELALLSLCDVLVDGEFIQEQRDLTLLFRGSKNQRVLNVALSLAAGVAVAEESDGWTGNFPVPF